MDWMNGERMDFQRWGSTLLRRGLAWRCLWGDVFSPTELGTCCWLNILHIATRSPAVLCGAFHTVVPLAHFTLLVAKISPDSLSSILSYLMKKSSLEKKKKVGCEAELIWVGDGKPPAASKVSLLIRGVRFAAKADTEGSFTVSAVHGILALVSVTLGQSHLYPLPWGFSLGGLGFFWTLRRFSSEGTCASKMPAVFSWVSLYVCLFDVSVPMYLSAFSKIPQDATFRTFKGVIRSL